tara:strand:+ start:88 stop:936 length:849 start_codon:yes stop_codon:yes gene_type:complete
MKRLLIICAAMFLIAGCSDKETEVKVVDTKPEPTMTELAESNDSYWGYIDYLWARNGDSYSPEAFWNYTEDWIEEANATGVAYSSFGYVPAEPNENFDGIWAVSWKSKALRDEAWDKWLARGSSKKLASANPDTITLGGEEYEHVYGFYAFRPRELSNPWDDIGPEQDPYNVDIMFCNFNAGQGFENLREVIAGDFSPWLDSYEAANPDASYNFSIEVPSYQPDPAFDYIWKNIHRNSAQADAGNAAWVESGGDIQAKFDTIADCQPPARFAGYSFVNDDEA